MVKISYYGSMKTEDGIGLASKYEVHFISYEKPVRINLNEPNIFFHKVTVPIYPLFEYPPYELALTARIVEVVKDFSLDLLHVHYAINKSTLVTCVSKDLKEKTLQYFNIQHDI